MFYIKKKKSIDLSFLNNIVAERKDQELKPHISHEPIAQPLQTAASEFPATCLVVASS